MQPDRILLCETYRGRWRAILETLGVPAKALVNRHGPCPVCGGKDRFRFDDKDRKGTFFCSHCGAGDGPKLAMLFTGLSFKDLADKLAGGGDLGSVQLAHSRIASDRAQREETSAAKRQRMNALWGKALPIKATDPAGIYLTARLGSLPTGTGLRSSRTRPAPSAPPSTVAPLGAGAGSAASRSIRGRP